jgi:hypothetical protein
VLGWLGHERAKSFNVFFGCLVYVENLCDKCLPWEGNLIEGPRRHVSRVGKIVSETAV